MLWNMLLCLATVGLANNMCLWVVLLLRHKNQPITEMFPPACIGILASFINKLEVWCCWCYLRSGEHHTSGYSIFKIDFYGLVFFSEKKLD